jgi:hypothetical protein
MIPYKLLSFRGGISDENTRGIKGSYKYSYGLDIHKKRDSLSCNWAMLNIGKSTVVKDLIRYYITARDGSTYAFGNMGSVYAISGNPKDPVVSGVYNDENGEIRGAAEWKQDDGNNYLYWATATSLARTTLNGSPPSTWPAGMAIQNYRTNLDDYPYHPMKNAVGDLCIGNGNFLATVDYDGTWDNAAMNLRPGNIIKCLEERDDYVIIGSERVDTAEEGYLWSWTPTARNWIQKRKVPVKGVNSLIDTELILLQGGKNGELFYSDFVNKAPLNSMPNELGQTNPMGVAIYKNLALFGIYGAGDQTGIYSLGRRSQNRPMAFNQEFRVGGENTIAEIGAVWVASSAVYASYQANGSATYYGIDMVSTSTRAKARYEGLEFTGENPHLKKTLKTLKTTMEKLPAGCGVSILYKTDRATTSGDGSGSQGPGWRYATVSGGMSTTYSTTNSDEAEFIINDTGKTFEIGVELTPSGSSTPEVTGLIGYFGDEAEDH